MMIPLEEKQISSETCTLYYYTAGSPANPALVFIHPAYGDHTCFHHQLDAFAGQYHVITLDMLGHGKSQVRDGRATIEQTAAFITKILAQEGHSRAHLVGISLGALMAQYIADQYPQQVQTVSAVGGYSIFGDNSAITRAQNREMLRAQFLVLFWMDGFRRYVVQNTNVVAAEREVFYRAMQNFTRGSLRVMTGMSKILTKTPKTLSQPLLIVVGEHDLALIRANAQNWQTAQPGAQLQRIPAAGHCANMDNPAVFNQVLNDFLNSQPR